jgi:hypothetical protein
MIPVISYSTMAESIAHAPTYVGTLDLKTILEIICTKLDCTELLARMQAQYESERATVTSRKTGQEVVRLERRSGSRLTFGKDVVALIDQVINAQQRLPDGSVIEPSHGDVLFYKPGDYFHRHRDTPPDTGAIGTDKTFYTLLVGLTDTLSGGETEVVDAEGQSHVYDQPAKRGAYLLFASEKLHSGLKVNDGCKLVLKLDYWLPTPRSGGPQAVPTGWNRSHDYDEVSDYDPREDEDWCNGYHLD